jgi:hypothetical protein
MTIIEAVLGDCACVGVAMKAKSAIRSKGRRDKLLIVILITLSFLKARRLCARGVLGIDLFIVVDTDFKFPSARDVRCRLRRCKSLCRVSRSRALRCAHEKLSAAEATCGRLRD